MTLPRAPFIRALLAALVIAFALVVSSLVRAWKITPVEAASTTAAATTKGGLLVAPIPEIDIDAIGANNIFQPTRTSPGKRYPMPGDPVPVDATPAPEAPRPTVLGTVIAIGGESFATAQMPGGRPATVRVGSKVGDYTVVTIERNKVVFRTTTGALIEIGALRKGS